MLGAGVLVVIFVHALSYLSFLVLAWLFEPVPIFGSVLGLSSFSAVSISSVASRVVAASADTS